MGKNDPFRVMEKYKEPKAKWHKIKWVKCLDLTEGSGYWKKNTVMKMLMDGLIVFTPFAYYKATSGLSFGVKPNQS